jgi:hypothetical protein
MNYNIESSFLVYFYILYFTLTMFMDWNKDTDY